MTLVFKARCPTCGHVVRHRIRHWIVVAERCYHCGRRWPMFAL